VKETHRFQELLENTEVATVVGVEKLPGRANLSDTCVVVICGQGGCVRSARLISFPHGGYQIFQLPEHVALDPVKQFVSSLKAS